MRLKALMLVPLCAVSIACQGVAEGGPGGNGVNAIDSAQSSVRAVTISPAGLVEEIYAFRTTLDSRVLPATEFCANVGFNATFEDQYTAWSYRQDFNTGRIADPQFLAIGSFRACGGPTATPGVINIVLFGSVGELPQAELRGTCQFFTPNTPETGARGLSCTLTPTAEGYVGGRGITNSMSAANIPAYQQPSFMHLRLWRHATDDEIANQ